MRPGILHAWMASVTEIAAGGLLVLGLLTPIGGAGVVGVMLVAWITNHLRNGFFIFRPGEGWEYVMVLTFVGRGYRHAGAGPVEHRRARVRAAEPVGVARLLDRSGRRWARRGRAARGLLASRPEAELHLELSSTREGPAQLPDFDAPRA